MAVSDRGVEDTLPADRAGPAWVRRDGQGPTGYDKRTMANDIRAASHSDAVALWDDERCPDDDMFALFLVVQVLSGDASKIRL